MTKARAIIELQHNIDLPFGGSVSDEASEMAIKALEKQIPKKPIDLQYCPECKEIVFFGNKHCIKCGQKLDWSDEDDKKL